MFGKLLPKTVVFFDLFDQHAAFTVEAANVFYNAISQNAFELKHLEEIKALEHKADEIIRQCMEELHRTFITPFDREDIHHLISAMDDVIDFIDDAAECLVTYKINAIPSDYKVLAQALLNCTIEMEKGVKELRDLKNVEALSSYCLKIHQWEHEADVIYRNAVGGLFEKEQDLRLLIKWKELYQILENSCDRCDDVANVMEGVILDYY